MEIHSTTVYDKKTIEIFTRQSVKRIIPLCIVIFAFGSLFTITNIYEMAVLGASADVLFTSIFLFALLIFLIVYMFILLPKINYSIHKTATDAVNEYTFYNTKLFVNSNAKGIQSNVETEYSVLYKVIETKDYIYMYISKGRAYIVDKKTLSGGSVEDIRFAITSQIGIKKYKIKM